MSIFDKFRKKSNVNLESYEQPVNQLPYSISYNFTPNGNLQVEFYDPQDSFKKFYDTTRLIVRLEPLYIEGHRIYNCAVSWYGSNDCQIMDNNFGIMESPRAQSYRGVLTEIDLDLLQSDPNYCQAVMQNLLDKKRVERYLEDGLQEDPRQPCGKYIGGIRPTENGYGKFFSIVVGQASHNSKLMVNRRQQHREQMEAQKQRNIENKKAQIEKLQNELNDMER